ncbi:hypothetical protein PUR57_39955 [Streptomyces sp. JV176]|uniref:hypothetical protein n=1 Tax=Streptomyces sp. JV176 TaxID=858630 RepID=UPI002E77DE2C|nr:hypothetical protein [Streptomyces sp. JV176]MEE1804787.1 hypothetical protein [Streptomyces sp. JV176]
MIEILTSGVALGVHVPGLLLADRLREQGADAEVRVLERLLPERTLTTTAAMKWAFHRNFRFALTGQRVATDPSATVADGAVEELMDTWRAERIDRFVVFSGYWLPIVERYMSRYGAAGAAAPPVDVCHVDSVASPSFVKTGRPAPGVRHVWLADSAGGRIPYSIPVTREPALPWAERDRRLLVHGGGWGIGTYRERARELRAHGFALDVVAYEEADVSGDDPDIRSFMVDPGWHPWLDDGYPPFGRVVPGEPTRFTRGAGHHGSFDLTRAAVATVSKPGGGTLLDSLWSATPAVLLEPYGGHEERNTELWQELGFGITFARWAETGFDMAVIEKLHHTLREAAAHLPDYSRLLAEEAAS